MLQCRYCAFSLEFLVAWQNFDHRISGFPRKLLGYTADIGRSRKLLAIYAIITLYRCISAVLFNFPRISAVLLKFVGI